MNNTQLFEDLLAEGGIALQDCPLLHSQPQALPPDFNFARIEGMLLGLAIGDALGNTSEGVYPRERRQTYGEIRDYLPNRHAASRRVGLPSDDTQMAFWTLEQLIADRGLVPDHLAQRFCRESIFGIGSTVKDFLRAYKDQKVPWQKAGQPSAGNGAIMRIAPLLIPHLKNPTTGLWADAALAGMITHNDRASNAACVAFIHLLWELLRMPTPLAADGWSDIFCADMAALEGQTKYQTRRGVQYEGPCWRFVQESVGKALAENLPTLDACESWGSGAYLLETLPCALYILAKYGGNAEEALVRAVNDTKDNDSIAAVVGAAVGALHGSQALPKRWVEGLLGRTGAADDGRVFELLGEL